MSARTIAARALDQGGGIVRLAPNWVPRIFCVPGRRIKLHPEDCYALGTKRGGIDERWLSSTTPANNGPLTGPDEGLSFVVVEDGGTIEKILLRDAVTELKGALIGDRIWNEHQCLPMYAKLFDNQGALPLHIHPDDAHAARANALGKPEAYYFPAQVNNHWGDFPYTFFGLQPGTTKEQVRAALERFPLGDNRITDLSVAYRLRPGSGWNVPPGVLHAPGSMCTYEPQRASDVAAMYQSVAGGAVLPEELLWQCTPEAERGNYDCLIDAIDWERNVDPDFKAEHFMDPRPVRETEGMRDAGYEERWVCYLSRDFSAKELTVLPGKTVTIADAGAYGLIMMQGHGRMGVWEVEAPALVRYGQLTYDEFFVSEAAATQGVTISNPSRSEPIVMLKHFGPSNPELRLPEARRLSRERGRHVSGQARRAS